MLITTKLTGRQPAWLADGPVERKVRTHLCHLTSQGRKPRYHCGSGPVAPTKVNSSWKTNNENKCPHPPIRATPIGLGHSPTHAKLQLRPSSFDTQQAVAANAQQKQAKDKPKNKQAAKTQLQVPAEQPCLQVRLPRKANQPSHKAAEVRANLTGNCLSGSH